LIAVPHSSHRSSLTTSLSHCWNKKTWLQLPMTTFSLRVASFHHSIAHTFPSHSTGSLVFGDQNNFNKTRPR
jgi:hypothetical protein